MQVNKWHRRHLFFVGDSCFCLFKTVLFFLIVFSLLACSEDSSLRGTSEKTGSTQSKPGLNLIIVSIDTLRADRLGSYGYNQPTSPFMDKLALRGIRFDKVIADSSWTLPSTLTMLTGLPPTEHGVTLRTNKLPTTIPTLAEVLKNNGYRTFGYTAGGYVSGKFGFNHGFEIYEDDRQSDFKKNFNLAKEKIKSLSTNERYFMFLHAYDVHCPYDPPEKYVKMLQTRPPEDHIATEGRCGNPNFNNSDLTSGQVRFLSDQYDAGIRTVDDDLKNFVQFLDEQHAFDNTILILVSDHGEEFKEHGQIGHEQTLYIESLHVPLIIMSPDIKPRVVHEGAGLADVMPTVLDLLGISAPKMQGKSLVPLMHGSSKVLSKRPLFSELDRHIKLRSIIYDSYHLIVNLEGGRWLFDLRVDPGELKNLADNTTEKEKQLFQILSKHLDEVSPREDVPKEEVPSKLLKELEALGYVN